MWQIKYRSSRPGVFYKKGVLINFAKFTGKYLCQDLFFNKIAGLGLKNRHFLRIASLNVTVSVNTIC